MPMQYICKLKIYNTKNYPIKMKQSKFFYSAMFAVASLTASAQINQTPITGGGRQIVGNSEKAMAAAGSMYINDKFLPAKLSDNATTVLLRYNAYSDYFEISHPQEQQSKALPKQAGVKITFINTGEEYTLVNYKKDNESLNGYLNIISENPKVKIYKRERIYLQPGLVSSNSYQTSKPATYKKAGDEFFAQLGDSNEALYFSSKKEFAKLVPAKSKEILDFIKKNNIDVEEAAGLQKLATYVQTIL